MMRLGIIWNDRWQMTDWRVSSPSVWRGAAFDRARINMSLKLAFVSRERVLNGRLPRTAPDVITTCSVLI
jgi:hypothetical protein